MKLYQTKNVLFYKKPTMASRMAQLLHEHKDKHGRFPRRIYVTGKEFSQYEKELSPYVRAMIGEAGFPMVKVNSRYSRPLRGKKGVICLTYRGIPIVRIDDWKELIKK